MELRSLPAKTSAALTHERRIYLAVWLLSVAVAFSVGFGNRHVITDKINAVYSQLGSEKKATKILQDYAGCMTQRAAIAEAVAKDPDGDPSIIPQCQTMTSPKK